MCSSREVRDLKRTLRIRTAQKVLITYRPKFDSIGASILRVGHCRKWAFGCGGLFVRFRRHENTVTRWRKTVLCALDGYYYYWICAVLELNDMLSSHSSRSHMWKTSNEQKTVQNSIRIPGYSARSDKISSLQRYFWYCRHSSIFGARVEPLGSPVPNCILLQRTCRDGKFQYSSDLRFAHLLFY